MMKVCPIYIMACVSLLMRNMHDQGHLANFVAMTLSAYGNLDNPNHIAYVANGKLGQQLDTRSAITSVCVSEVPLSQKQ